MVASLSRALREPSVTNVSLKLENLVVKSKRNPNPRCFGVAKTRPATKAFFFCILGPSLNYYLRSTVLKSKLKVLRQK